MRAGSGGGSARDGRIPDEEQVELKNTGF